MKILIVANAPIATNERWDSEKLSEGQVGIVLKSIQQVLAEKGHDVKTFFVDEKHEPFFEEIKKRRPDVVFNLCETLDGNSRLEPVIPFLLQWMKIPFTGNPPNVLAFLVDKILTKNILKGMKIPTPDFHGLFEPEDLKEWKHWPAILKPAAEDASLGIDEGSVVDNPESALARFKLLREKFGVPVLIEEFISGRELNVAVLETPDGLKIGINEIDFSNLPPAIPKILTYQAKWDEESTEFILTPVKAPANLEKNLDRKIRQITGRVFKSLGLRGYARVDYRISEDGKPFVLEINPNPDLSEGAGFFKALTEMGLSYPEALDNLIKIAKT